MAYMKVGKTLLVDLVKINKNGTFDFAQNPNPTCGLNP